MGGFLAEQFVRLRPELSGFRAETQAALVTSLRGINLGSLGGAALIGGAGIAGLATTAVLAAGGLGNIVEEGADLEAFLNELRVVSGATEEEMRALAESARDLGRDVQLPAVSASDAAASMTELSKAGLDVTDTLDGTRGVLELATAGNIEFAQSAEIVAAALNAFRLPGERAVSVADLLAGASIEAQGSIGDFGIAMQQAAAAAAQVGIPIEDTVAALTLLAQAGIQGSDAGTSLRTTLLRLVPTTKEAADIVEALGIAVADQEGRIRPLSAIFEDYRQALAQLDPVTRQAALTTIFGTDAFRAASVFAQAGARGFNEVERAITREGIAAEVAAAKAEGLRGDLAALDSASDTLAATLSNVTNPAIGSFAQILTGAITATDLGINALAELTAAAARPLFPAPPATAAQSLDDLVEALEEAQRAVRSFGGIEIAPPAFQNRLRELQAEVGQRLRSQLGAAGGDTEELRDRLIALGLSADQAATLVDQANQRIARSIRRVGEEGGNLLAESSAAAIRRRGEDFRAAGSEAGEQTGRAFSEGVGAGIDAEGRAAIAAARRLLADVRREGDQQIVEAIRGARENFESLGDTLGSEIAELLDAGPIAAEIEKVDEALARLQENVSRRRLRFDLTDAKRDLEEAQDSIAHVGEVTPEMRRAQEEFLAPFREKVADAKAAVKEFDLAEHREDLQATLEKQRQLAEDGITALIDRFEDGELSVDQFNQALTQRLGPALDALRTKAGKNLGLSFERDFLRNVEALREQAEALAGFLGRPGTAPGPTVARPADTVSDVQRRIADATANLAQVQKDAKKEAHDDANDVKDLLQQIRNRLPAQNGRR